MAEINLLRRYPRAKHNIEKRTGRRARRISVSPGIMGASISTDRGTPDMAGTAMTGDGCRSPRT